MQVWLMKTKKKNEYYSIRYYFILNFLENFNPLLCSIETRCICNLSNNHFARLQSNEETHSRTYERNISRDIVAIDFGCGILQLTNKAGPRRTSDDREQRSLLVIRYLTSNRTKEAIIELTQTLGRLPSQIWSSPSSFQYNSSLSVRFPLCNSVRKYRRKSCFDRVFRERMMEGKRLTAQRRMSYDAGRRYPLTKELFRERIFWKESVPCKHFVQTKSRVPRWEDFEEERNYSFEVSEMFESDFNKFAMVKGALDAPRYIGGKIVEYKTIV